MRANMELNIPDPLLITQFHIPCETIERSP